MDSILRVLGIGGSPRRGGNSEILLDEALRTAVALGASAEKIVLNDLSIAPCQECSGCDATGRCIVQDEMQDIYPRLRCADVMVLATPVFFSGPSAQLKAMIDRTQACWVERFVLKRPVSDTARMRRGLLLSVGARGGEANFQAVEKIVRTFFYTQSVKYQDGLFFPNVDHKAGILSVDGAMSRVQDAVQLTLSEVVAGSR